MLHITITESWPRSEACLGQPPILCNPCIFLGILQAWQAHKIYLHSVLRQVIMCLSLHLDMFTGIPIWFLASSEGDQVLPSIELEPNCMLQSQSACSPTWSPGSWILAALTYFPKQLLVGPALGVSLMLVALSVFRHLFLLNMYCASGSLALPPTNNSWFHLYSSLSGGKIYIDRKTGRHLIVNINPFTL